jgi:hypothetical protein
MARESSVQASRLVQGFSSGGESECGEVDTEWFDGDAGLRFGRVLALLGWWEGDGVMLEATSPKKNMRMYMQTKSIS